MMLTISERYLIITRNTLAVFHSMSYNKVRVEVIHDEGKDDSDDKNTVV
jgi:hypothetical protein